MAFLYFTISSTKKFFSIKKLMTVNSSTIKNNEKMRNRIFFLIWNKNQTFNITKRTIVVDGLMKILQTTENNIKKDE